MPHSVLEAPLATAPHARMDGAAAGGAEAIVALFAEEDPLEDPLRATSPPPQTTH